VEKCRNHVDCWVSHICEKVKDECLLAFRSLGGVATVG
jgi:hypothetical protein